MLNVLSPPPMASWRVACTDAKISPSRLATDRSGAAHVSMKSLLPIPAMEILTPADIVQVAQTHAVEAVNRAAAQTAAPTAVILMIARNASCLTGHSAALKVTQHAKTTAAVTTCRRESAPIPEPYKETRQSLAMGTICAVSLNSIYPLPNTHLFPNSEASVYPAESTNKPTRPEIYDKRPKFPSSLHHATSALHTD